MEGTIAYSDQKIYSATDTKIYNICFVFIRFKIIKRQVSRLKFLKIEHQQNRNSKNFKQNNLKIFLIFFYMNFNKISNQNLVQRKFYNEISSCAKQTNLKLKF